MGWQSVAPYLQQLDTADRQQPSDALKTKIERLKEKIGKLKEEMRRLVGLQAVILASPDQQISLTAAPGGNDGLTVNRPATIAQTTAQAVFTGPRPDPVVKGLRTLLPMLERS